MNIYFFQRGETIYVKVTEAKELIRLSTGIKIPRWVKFVQSKQRFKGDEADLYNYKLDQEKIAITELWLQYKDLDKVRVNYSNPTYVSIEEDNSTTYDFNELVVRYVRGMRSGEIKTKRGNRRMSDNSCHAFEASVRNYLSYTKLAGGLKLDELDLSNKNLQEKTQIGKIMNDHFDGFVKFLRRKQLQINSQSNILNQILIILTYYKEVLYLNIPRASRISGEDIPIITLDVDFVSKFIRDDHKLYNKFSDRYKFAWEASALMMTTSLRISDAMSITLADIRTTKDGMFLIKQNKKTRQETTVPIIDSLAQVLSANIGKYGNIYTPAGREDKAKMLRRICKDFFQQYPEMHQIIHVNHTLPDGKRTVASQPMYELVHPHMLRKTAITTMLALGLEREDVKIASGHTANSQSFEKYVGHVDKIYKNKMYSFHDRLKNETT